MHRREFLSCSALLGTASAFAQVSAERKEGHWNAGRLAHILPTVNHYRIRLKTSFVSPLSQAPRLFLDKRAVPGIKVDSAGYFWNFDVAGLSPGRKYELELRDASNQRLCDAWPLKTFPAPDESPQHLRVLIYTCAGGHDGMSQASGATIWFLPSAVRARMLDRALSFTPDAIIANGDHVYWDQRSTLGNRQRNRPIAAAIAGEFNRDEAIIGTQNESILLKAVGPQIVPLYGTRCHSTPVFFLRDDHDYFDNDEATDQYVTFPPDEFQSAAARMTQRLYYPEFLWDVNQPSGLPGLTSYEGSGPLSESYGTLRYGRLAEFLMYDCRRNLTLFGPSGNVISPVAEDWLKARMAARDVAHLINVPSNPPGWSAGKWGEWYADLLEDSGKLGVTRRKPYWQPGWRAKHDRILKAASEMADRLALFISGDLHCTAEERILSAGSLSFRANPIVAALSGTLGTGNGWPSASRGVKAMPPVGLSVESHIEPIEENGFLLADFEPNTITLRYFRFDARTQTPDVIDRLEPFHVTTLRKPA
jgi:hypothetical protein